MYKKRFVTAVMLLMLLPLCACGRSNVSESPAASNSSDASGSNNVTEDTNATNSLDVSSDIDAASDAVILDIGETKEKGLWTQTTVYPSNIDDTFVIDVCLPDDYDASLSYPVVYLTDCYWRRGDYQSIKDLYLNGTTKEFILIGIGYPEDYNFDLIRIRDLLNNPQEFLRLILDGIIPYVEENYNIDATDRTFCGASYGGFFMVYSLFQPDGMTTGVFKNYVLASPTFKEYTYDEPLAAYEEMYYEKTKELSANVYISVGELEDVYAFRRPIQNFIDLLETRDYTNLSVTYKVYDGLEHYTVWVPTLLDGLTLYLGE